MADPVEFVVKKLPYDLSSHGGLALVGRLFKRINLPAMIDPQYPVRGGIANSDIVKCYLALLTLGKNDFEAVEVRISAHRGRHFRLMVDGVST